MNSNFTAVVCDLMALRTRAKNVLYCHQQHLSHELFLWVLAACPCFGILPPGSQISPRKSRKGRMTALVFSTALFLERSYMRRMSRFQDFASKC